MLSCIAKTGFSPFAVTKLGCLFYPVKFFSTKNADCLFFYPIVSIF